ncbi:MAG: NADH-quinone oxidoreductase subunit J [Phycisphaeraceae bacterium]|nr:NADH-quinone oxidoreductase subunit J [Phycisphaeraceae bacterium]
MDRVLMDMIVHPALLFLALAIGGVGVALSIPRRRFQASLVGGIIAATGVGLLIVGLGGSALSGDGTLPSPVFHVLAIIALGSCLQVITHRRPVYAALYFILSILATAGLYILLAAEFMAFALVIIYAGAILITYLFVIMLASQSQVEGQEEGLAEYDAVGRGPITATVASFALLAALTVLVFSGLKDIPAPDAARVAAAEMAVLDRLPGKVEKALAREGLIESGEIVVGVEEAQGVATAVVRGIGGGQRRVALPESVSVTNTEGLAFNLLGDYPGTIEIAGVILLMAMLGAVVLARKFAQIDEEAKAAAAAALAEGSTTGGQGHA